jgi:hypothetical protein
MNDIAQNQRSNALQHRPFLPVPTERSNWIRKTDFKRTINDMVEDLHLELVETSDEYRGFLDAVWDEQAIEGSLAADNTMAAQLIRAEAVRRNVPQIATAKLATIVKALNIVLRRYGVSRNDRRNMVGGENVANGDSD